MALIRFQVTLERPADSKWTQRKRTVYAKYVVGCDGARSWVREKVGIKLERRERGARQRVKLRPAQCSPSLR